MKYDIITFGSAIKDTFLRLNKKHYQVLADKAINNKCLNGSSFCFPLGAKIFIENLQTASGGGATNTAATFSNQGFRVAACSKVGRDRNGETIIQELEKFNIETRFIKKDRKHPTALSIILSLSQEDRTILIYRGACHFMTEGDMAWRKIKKTQWFYLAPLSGKSVQIFEPLVNFARNNKIRIAVNPGNAQLKLPANILKSLLSEIDILILNKEEAVLLTGPSENEEELMRKLKSFGPKIVVVTKGKAGSIVFDGKYLFRAGVPAVSVFEKTGAGDAFASGFLTGILQKDDISYAIQLATANAVGCMQKIGAKNGLLKKTNRGLWPRVEVIKEALA